MCSTFCPRGVEPSDGEHEQILSQERLDRVHLGLELRKLEVLVHSSSIYCIKVRLLQTSFFCTKKISGLQGVKFSSFYTARDR